MLTNLSPAAGMGTSVFCLLIIKLFNLSVKMYHPFCIVSPLSLSVYFVVTCVAVTFQTSKNNNNYKTLAVKLFEHKSLIKQRTEIIVIMKINNLLKRKQ